jgi:cytochrome P450/NADPH-cytochrome P450 reductase
LVRFTIHYHANSANILIELKSTLTVKPAGLKLKARRRPGKGPMVGIPGAISSAQSQIKEIEPAIKEQQTNSTKSPLHIVYGSNAGTCKSLAEDLQTFSGSRFEVTIQTMDHATEHLPKDGPVIIITPSYEGKPADNARKFVSWLESSADTELLEGVKFAMFGVGNSDWTQTFHRIPRLVDETMPKLGAERFHPTGFVNVKEDFVGPWDDWKEKLISTILGTKTEPLMVEELQVEFVKSDAAIKLGGEEMSYGYVRKNDVIAGTEVGPEKRHMEVELPEGATYQTGQSSIFMTVNIYSHILGDYLVVLPTNPAELVKRAMARFKLSSDDLANISGTSKSFLVRMRYIVLLMTIY